MKASGKRYLLKDRRLAKAPSLHHHQIGVYESIEEIIYDYNRRSHNKRMACENQPYAQDHMVYNR